MSCLFSERGAHFADINFERYTARPGELSVVLCCIYGGDNKVNLKTFKNY